MADLRPAIIRLWQIGKKKSEISRELIVPYQTVSDAIKRFEETGSNEDRVRSGRPATADTPENRRKIEEKICHCNGHEEGHIQSKTDSTRKLGKELGVSHMSVQRMEKEVFELKSRKTVEGHQLDKDAKDKRLIRCKRLARRFAAGRHRNILFTDEKWFDMMDYFVWPYLESQACSKPHNSIAALKASLVQEWDEIPQDMIQNAIDEFPKRLRKCIEANGGHFEWIK